MKRNKYKNSSFMIDGQKWDSKKEYNRWLVLLNARKNGIISELERQVKYELVPAVREQYIEHLKTKDKIKERVVQQSISYTCDFRYKKGDEIVVEDVKASPKLLPKEFVLKEKLMFALKGIRIRKIFSANESV